MHGGVASGGNTVNANFGENVVNTLCPINDGGYPYILQSNPH